MRHGLWVGAVAISVAFGSAVGIALALNRPATQSAASASPPEAQVTWPAGGKPAPLFALHDQDGRLVSLRAARGRIVLVTFLNSRCRSECPLEGRVLAELQQRLRGVPATVDVVSVNPWADNRASARAFARKAHWQGDWHWLLGGKATLSPVWRAYDVGVRRIPGDILHSTALYVIDTRGDVRAGYLFPFSADAVARDVRALLSSGA